jgi:hypothetical protein
MVEDDETIERHFNCKVCGISHRVKLNKKLLKGRTKFPFPYVYLHDHINGVEHKEVLTILYIDNNLQIRHSEIQELGYDSLFSKEQVEAITKPLIKEIELLRDEIKKLNRQIDDLKIKLTSKHYTRKY